MTDKIQTHPRQRKAILYIRQSSAYQVCHNVESQKLQYGMETRLRQLGWQEIEVVDEDLGRSAAGGVQRLGFEGMVAEVCLGRVGAVAAREVSRFARNSREWQQLVEMCRVVDTLLIDQEAVYSPRLSNDRLLLGLKGSLNEYELDLLRQRSLEARHEKARRGELLIGAPVGFLKTDDHRLEKDPDRRVQEALLLVFRKFFERGSVRQTLVWFLQEDLLLPARLSNGATDWRRPNYASVYRILTNPAYAGAYAYGKTEMVTSYAEGRAGKNKRRKPASDWLVLLPQSHEGYISWQQYEQIQRLIADNRFGWGGTGAAKHGQTLLAGILRCRRCGRKIGINYTGSDHGVLRYLCQLGWVHDGEERCISFGGTVVDAAIGREMVRVVQPGAVEAAAMAYEEAAHVQDEVAAALQRDLEAARYSARRAEKQFQGADPENRLVADELERRWELALRRVGELERRIELQAAGSSRPAVADRAELADLAKDVAAVWDDPQCDVRLKKRIVRSLIHEVIADVDVAAGEIVLVIHWQGGLHTELRVPRRRRGGHGHATSKDIVATVRILARVCSDRMIAGFLHKNGLRTGKGNRWTTARVVALRCRNQIPGHNTEIKREEGWMNLKEASAFLGVAPGTLRLSVERGQLQGEHPLTDGPWVFRRQELETDAAARLVQQARSRTAAPAKPSSEQETSDFFGT